jgi:pimeloyl-ACP methyl ester carboxylesterase
VVRAAIASAWLATVLWPGEGVAQATATAGAEAFEVQPGITVDVHRLAAGPQAPAGALPIYFIAGGPAVGPAEELARRPALFHALQNLGEVVLVGQRGAGGSRPSMDCHARWALPLDRVPSRAEVVADARRQFRLCTAALRARGVDPGAYRTEAYALDLRTVMHALGHRQVRLVAHSYGTMIALELLRQDSGRVERAVLAGVMGPGDALRNPLHHERVLGTLAQSQGLQAAHLSATVAKVLARVARVPLTADTGDGVAVVLGRDDIARGLLQTLGRPAEASRLPALAEALAAGRRDAVTHAWLRKVAEDTRDARTGPLARRAPAQHYLTVCANGEPDARRRARLARSLFGQQLHLPLPEACDGWGLPPASARGPVSADLPVLLISAKLDVRTPHEQALAVQETLPSATLVTLAEAGHGEVLGPYPGLEPALISFLRGELVAPTLLRRGS